MGSETIQNLISSGVGITLSSCDSTLFPEVASGDGLIFDNSTGLLTVIVSKSRVGQTLENLKRHPHLAVSISRPIDNLAVQFKCLITNIRPASFEETELTHEQWRRYMNQASLVGVAPEIVAHLKVESDIAIESQVRQIFDQTPGPRAGKAISGEGL